jgi:hypothetical protein
MRGERKVQSWGNPKIAPFQDRDEGQGARGETSNRLNVRILGFPSSLTPHPSSLITNPIVTSNLRY